MEAAYAAAYRGLYERHFWWRAREALLVQVIDALPFARGGHVLDVGCGDGLFFPQLERFGEVHGVESDPALVSERGRYRGAIFVGPFDARYAPEQRFSLILMLDVLEHLDDPTAALRHALRLLRPDGALVITVPAFRLLWSEHDVQNQHRVRYTRASFLRLASAAEMRVDRCQYFFHWMFAAKLASRVREQLAGPKGAPERVPPAAINALAYGLSRVEQRLFTSHPLPFGSSLLATGGRGDAPAPAPAAGTAPGPNAGRDG